MATTTAPVPYADVLEIGRLNSAFAQSRILSSAVEVGLFELLDQAPADAGTVADRLALEPRLVPDFLRALTALGLVERAEDGRYRNSPAAAACLVPGRPYYLGPSVRATATRHYAAWSRLTDALRGTAPAEDGRGPDAFARLYQQPELARRFLAHMDSAHALVGPQLAEVVDWSRYASFVDVGGARGHIASVLVQAHPHLTGAVFELPAVEPFFHEYAAETGTADRLSFHGGDFFTDPLPRADVLVYGHVLHDWTEPRRAFLLELAFRTLRSGGALIVYDQMLDDDEPALGAVLGSLQVALATGGSEYPVAEGRAEMERAGFVIEDGRRIRTTGSDYVLIGVKP